MKTKKIDQKHAIGVNEKGEPFLFKVTNNQPIPDEEPTILFRGRDKLALPMLKHYRALCAADGATEYQLETMDAMIKKFEDFAQSSRTMKQPGITKGW